MSKRISILGAGESGLGAALLAQKKGLLPFVSDRGSISEPARKEMDQARIPWEQGKHSEDRLLDADEIVKSPGIPQEAPLVQRALEKGIPVISEIEFAGRYTQAKTVCITGTNGKTTTTALTYHVLKGGGLNVGIAGNIGKSFARVLATEEEREVYVLELSSFQLDNMYRFKADVAVLLNITPDHLDRYGYAMERYVDAKFRIAQNQDASSHFIYNADDPTIKHYLNAHTLAATPWALSLEKGPEHLTPNCAYIEDKNLKINTLNHLFTMKLQELALQGKHNLVNSMAAGVTGRIFELRKELVRDSLTNFENLEHRLETVAKVNDVVFINDSKATNVNSTWYAIESIDKPIIWIAGGVDKGNDYSDLLPLVKQKVKALICLGTDNSKLIESFGGHVPVILEAGSAREAVQAAYDLAYAGEVVLLSPACASFDLFQNYEDRGQQFKKAVRAL